MLRFSSYNPSTASKLENRYPENYPKNILKGRGCYIDDGLGNKYIDFVNALGPIILGYRYNKIDLEVIKYILTFGEIFSLSHPMEYELANILCEMIPSAEMVRFAHNGKDVTEAAVRLARHITGKDIILSFSYHGASDTFMAGTPANKGVLTILKDYIINFDYNDEKFVQQQFETNKNIACIIMEPHTIREPKQGYLEFLRDICTKNNALLIFDEVVSFPRYPGYSAQAYFNVIPDLTCISKGMANGYAISALVGKEKYMKHLCDNEVFFSTTQGGNLIGVSAAIATLNEIIDYNVTDHIKKMGELFRYNINKNNYFTPVGYPWRQFFEYKNDETRTIFWQECIKEGIFMGIPIFFNYSMKETDILNTTTKINKIIKRMPNCKLEGRKSSEVFKKV